jgi:hypothetical protein
MTDEERDRRMWMQGYNAFTKGWPISANPHMRGFADDEAWNEGWIAAQDYARTEARRIAERRSIREAKQKRNAQNRIERANAHRERLRSRK